jgi:hypothetical protein
MAALKQSKLIILNVYFWPKADDVYEERHSPVIIKSNGFCRPKADIESKEAKNTIDGGHPLVKKSELKGAKPFNKYRQYRGQSPK